MTQFTRALMVAAFATALIGSAAQAAPITMNPSPVILNGGSGSFTITLTSGDTNTNRLDFSVTGTGNGASTLASISFSGVSVLSAHETSDPGNMIGGLAIGSTVGGLLLDLGAPSSAAFFVRLSGTPTSATITGISTSKTHKLFGFIPSIVKQSIDVRFHTNGGGEVPIPEPSAALCFAAGLTLVATRLRRA